MAVDTEIASVPASKQLVWVFSSLSVALAAGGLALARPALRLRG